MGRGRVCAFWLAFGSRLPSWFPKRVSSAPRRCGSGPRVFAGIGGARKASRSLLCVNHTLAWGNFTISAWVRAHPHSPTVPFQNRWEPCTNFPVAPADAGPWRPGPTAKKERKKKKAAAGRSGTAGAPRRLAAIASCVRDRGPASRGVAAGASLKTQGIKLAGGWVAASRAVLEIWIWGPRRHDAGGKTGHGTERTKDARLASRRRREDEAGENLGREISKTDGRQPGQDMI